MQEASSQAEHAAAMRIAELEREGVDSRDVHLALAAQHEAKVHSFTSERGLMPPPHSDIELHTDLRDGTGDASATCKSEFLHRWVGQAAGRGEAAP